MNGWKLVPVEPTSEMLVAALNTNGICPQYAAMLVAAPQPPVGDACYEISPDPTVRAAFAQGYETGVAHGREQQPPAGEPVIRWLPQKTPIGTVLKPSAEGYLVMLQDHLSAVTARDQQITALQARVADDLCADGAHEFVPFQPACVKCGEPYAQKVAAVGLPERPYASEEEQAQMTEYEIGIGHGGCEMWDAVEPLVAGLRAEMERRNKEDEHFIAQLHSAQEGEGHAVHCMENAEAERDTLRTQNAELKRLLAKVVAFLPEDDCDAGDAALSAYD